MNTTPPALSINDLSVSYGTAGRRKKAVPVVQQVTFNVTPGRTMGLVGESGSGKSTILKAILGLARATSGSIELNGRDITHASTKERRSVVADLRAVFQDPFASLSPYQTIGATVTEALRLRGLSREQVQQRAGEALESVGLAKEDLNRYPHQFSGGQRQRIGIARALVSNPQVILMDEPVSALDLSAQAQVLNLLADLRDHGNYAMLFVAHDLGAVRFLCQDVVVLYRGMVMEVGTAEDVTTRPKNPYTQSLVNAAPVSDPAYQAGRRLARLTGQPREALVPADGAGCPFAPRCPLASQVCRTKRPELRPLDGKLVACHNAT